MTQPVPQKPIRVLLVEDSIPIRQRLRALIHLSDATQVVGEAGSVAAASFLLRISPPDAVILDLHLWDGLGYSVLAEAKRLHPACMVIVLTNFGGPEERGQCLELGADHFLDKALESGRIPELLAALHRRAPDSSPLDSHPKEARP